MTGEVTLSRQESDTTYPPRAYVVPVPTLNPDEKKSFPGEYVPNNPEDSCLPHDGLRNPVYISFPGDAAYRGGDVAAEGLHLLHILAFDHYAG